VPNGESISDHMYRMGLITMLAPVSISSKLDISHCTKMALVHDMAESLVGDITPVDGVNKPEKSRREATTMDYICSTLLGNVDGGVAGEEIKAIWREYEDAKTPESIFVHDVDKVELLLQMVEYEKAYDGKLSLDEFAYVANKVETPEVKVWCDELLAEQKVFWETKGQSHAGAASMNEKDPEHKRQVDEYYTH
jgi:putative hydrolase of HD superfamily